MNLFSTGVVYMRLCTGDQSSEQRLLIVQQILHNLLITNLMIKF